MSVGRVGDVRLSQKTFKANFQKTMYIYIILPPDEIGVYTSPNSQVPTHWCRVYIDSRLKREQNQGPYKNTCHRSTAPGIVFIPRAHKRSFQDTRRILGTSRPVRPSLCETLFHGRSVRIQKGSKTPCSKQMQTLRLMRDN